MKATDYQLNLYNKKMSLQGEAMRKLEVHYIISPF